MVSIEYNTPIHSPGNELQDLTHAPFKITIRSRIDDDEEESISPRIVNRRLDFFEVSPSNVSFIPFVQDEDRLSPVSIEPDGETVGECGICYKSLPLRSNHIFTVCGHLFCVNCLFNWNQSSSTCPLCRESLYQNVFVHDRNDDSFSVSTDDEIITSMLDRFIYDDDGIDWTNSVHEDDDVILLSREEIFQLRHVRRLTITLICRRLYLDSLLSNFDFTGEIEHTFIPRTDYTYISPMDIGYGCIFEFVICRNSQYEGDEKNYFGHITEITVITVENSHLQDHPTWESTHEYCFKVNVFNPNIMGMSYDESSGTFDTIPITFRFSDVRRLYTVRGIFGARV